MANVTLHQIRKSFGAVDIIKGIDLDIADGEFCVFVGPSGCGKSTLLRMIAGLEEATGGSVEIGGRDVTDVAPADRGVAMVFQSYALYPHMTVEENIGFGLRMAKRPREEIEARVKEASGMLQLGHLLDRRPAQLSGGQRQRVAIGRAIVRHPEVFLFDEPLSNLDAALRVQMRIEISKLHNQLGATMIYVTHDQVEAMTMADKIVVLQAGIIEQIGDPLELYHRPRNLFVAGFIGSPKMNFLKGTAAPIGESGARVTFAGGARIDLGKPKRAIKDGEEVTLGIRPEHLQLPGVASVVLPGTVKLAEHLGSESLFYIGLADGTEVSVKADGRAHAHAGEPIQIGVPINACHLFDAQGLALINGDLNQ